MEKLPRTLYSLEFRQQSVQFLKENGLALVEAATLFVSMAYLR